MSIEDIVRYRNILQEAAGGFDPAKILSVLVPSPDEGVLLDINVGKPFENVMIDDISMYVAYDEDEGSGDLAVNYTLNDPSDSDDAMAMFYSEEAYTAELADILIAHGFSPEAASRVCGSESGMQDEGRASYDAYDIEDEIRKAMATVSEDELGAKLGTNILKNNGFDISNIEGEKAKILKWALKKIKGSHSFPLDVRMALSALKNAGAKWPEIDTMLAAANG